MKFFPKHKISAEQAFDLLKEGQSISDALIYGVLRIEVNGNWEQELVFENCVFEFFSGSVTHFAKPVRFSNCRFKNCQFVFSYFLAGLFIENCTFEQYLDFQAGGHNKAGALVELKNNHFEGFVNFFDCWYESEVRICDNRFEKGSNLLGSPKNIPVRFDVTPLINNNNGSLDHDHEGTRKEV